MTDGKTIGRFDKRDFDHSIERYEDGDFVLYADHIAAVEAALREFAAQLPAGVPDEPAYDRELIAKMLEQESRP